MRHEMREHTTAVLVTWWESVFGSIQMEYGFVVSHCITAGSPGSFRCVPAGSRHWFSQDCWVSKEKRGCWLSVDEGWDVSLQVGWSQVQYSLLFWLSFWSPPTTEGKYLFFSQLLNATCAQQLVANCLTGVWCWSGDDPYQNFYTKK